MTRRLTVGVMGHVDHGKTALVRALTGQDTDRLPEEKRRGISIALGFAHARCGEAEVDFIDMPGHERFVRTLVSGATGVDAALLVVAANAGVQPQTLEHLEVAAQLGLRQVLAVVTKADMVTAEIAQAMAAALDRRIAAAGLDAVSTPPVSATDGRGLDALRDTLAGLAAPARDDDGFAWLPVDRAFTLTGHGTVVTGTLRRGVLHADAELVATPGDRPVRLRGLQVHGRAVEEAHPGQRVAANLRGIEPQAVGRGAALVVPGALAPATWLSVRVRASEEAALHDGMHLRLLFGTAEVEARLRLLDRDAIAAGEAAQAQIYTSEPVAIPARERFVLRLASPARTVGGGVALDPDARRLRRRDPGVLAELAALVDATPEQIVRHTLVRAGMLGVTRVRLARLAGIASERMAALSAAAGALDAGGVLVAADALHGLEARIRAVLAAQAETQPNGLSRRRLAALLPASSPAVLALALDRMGADGVVQADGATVRLPPPRAEAQARARQAAALAAQMLERLRLAALAPPDLGELAPTPLARRILAELARDGRAIHTLDRVQKRELYFHPDAVAQAKACLRPLLGGVGLTTGEAGAALGATRKFSVPLLEYLDTIRFTRRLGDRRQLGPDAGS